MKSSQLSDFDMDIRQLEMFLAVAEENGFTRAGERLHVSQSAISRQIGLLEKELGGPLFNRDGRRVSLTQPGEILVRAAYNVFREMQRVVEQLSDVHELRRGRIRLAGGMSVCMYILPRLLKRYRRLHPDVDVRVSSGSSEEILRKLRGHEMDLALLTLPVIAEDLQVVPVLKEEMVVVTAQRHPLARKRMVSARDRDHGSVTRGGRSRLAPQAPGHCPDPWPEALSGDGLGLLEVGLRSAH